MSGPDETPDGAAGDVGSVGEEAAKLFGALTDWARDHGLGDVAGTAGGAAADAARAARAGLGEVDEHIATGSAECGYCPVCRGIQVVRQTTPEVRAHLASAGASLLQAAAGILATVAADPATPTRAAGVEHIDLDDDVDDPRDDPGDDLDAPAPPDTDPAAPHDRPGSPS